MEYGSGRLIDVREGPNVRLSFGRVQGGRPVSVLGRLTASPCARTLTSRAFFDNVPNHAVGFWGVYGVRPLTKTIQLDAYYLALDRKKLTFNRGVARRRHSIGARLSRPAPRSSPAGISTMKRFGNSEPSVPQT